MKRSFLCALAALTVGTLLPLATAHAVIPFKGIARLQNVKRTGKHYKASSTYPVFSSSTTLTRFINAKLRTESTSGVLGFARDTTKDKDWQPSADLPWSYESNTRLYYYVPSRLVSLTQEAYVYTGGAHGNYGSSARNFALLPGFSRPRELKLVDFYRPGSAVRPRLEKLLLAKLKAKNASFVVDGSVKKIDATLLDNFVAERDGLRWFFPPYAVASFAEGEIEVKLSLAELGPDFKKSILLAR